MKHLWINGEVAYGIWTTLADPVTIGLAGRAGFEYTCIDLQHGLATFAELPTILRFLEAAPTTPIVRVPANETPAITRALDLGARGVVVPMINTAADAARAVAAARYPALPTGQEPADPATQIGERSWGPIFADLDGVAVTDDDNAAISVIIMIETAQALENVAEIAAVPGVSALYVGPNDLALSLGYGRATYRSEPAMEEAISRVVTAAQQAGIVAGVHCSDPQMVHYWRDRGAQMLTTALDTTLAKQAFGQRYQVASGAAPAPEVELGNY